MTTLAPGRLAVLKRVATIESIGSSTRIEGAKLTDPQVEEMLGRLEQQSFVSRDEQEVAGYAEVMEAIFESWEAIPLTENYLKQLHVMLLRHSTRDEQHRGDYKKTPNSMAFTVYLFRLRFSIFRVQCELTQSLIRARSS